MQDAAELLGRVGFVQEFKPVHALLGDHVAVARSQHHRQARQPVLQLLRKRDPAHPGHDHVREHQVEPVALRSEPIQRLLGIGGPGGPVAQILEDLRCELTTPTLSSTTRIDCPAPRGAWLPSVRGALIVASPNETSGR